MILSDDGIKSALQAGALEISPNPSDAQYTTSAVDLFLGDEFHAWDTQKLKLSGFKPELDLSQQEFAKTARAFLIPLKKQDDGSVIFPPFSEQPWHMLAITASAFISTEVTNLRHGSRAAALSPELA